MTMAYAVIGAGYGDEGKGVTVDALASLYKGVVVRSNGGAQAGHTVVSPSGERHVFHHVGAGAFAGAKTHLSQFFAVNPMFFLQERKEVLQLDGNVEVSIDPRAPVTTPFDVMINQAIEVARGVNKHGSCGLGFGETIERNQFDDFRLTYADLVRNDLRDRLIRIRDNWVPVRLEKLNLTNDAIQHLLGNDDILERYLLDCREMLDCTTFLHDRKIQKLGAVIFEGAQGLMLDQDYGVFPHVTRSNTGLLNMAVIAKEAGITDMMAHYCTRAYVTRHGAGPLDHEGENLNGYDLTDLTNIPNDWQGAIRHAPLDANVLKNAIYYDINRVQGINVKAGIVVTCLDQLPNFGKIFIDGVLEFVRADLFCKTVSQITGLGNFGMGINPERGGLRITYY